MEDPMKQIRSMESSLAKINPEDIRTKFFREEAEIRDDADESYADIKIPDFRDGRRGRFIHDYKNNQTTIVDEGAHRCFVYPLDFTTTMPPSSMMDVFMKMSSGYYFPDTSLLRKKMRVVVPAMEADDEFLSSRTTYVCEGMKIYKLEPFVSGVYKRSADVKDAAGKFAAFGGRGLMEVDLVNIAEVKEYETNLMD